MFFNQFPVELHERIAASRILSDKESVSHDSKRDCSAKAFEGLLGRREGTASADFLGQETVAVTENLMCS